MQCGDYMLFRCHSTNSLFWYAEYFRLLWMLSGFKLPCFNILFGLLKLFVTWANQSDGWLVIPSLTQCTVLLSHSTRELQLLDVIFWVTAQTSRDFSWHSAVLSANTGRRPNVDSMLAQRLRRWANIASTLGGRFVFAGLGSGPGLTGCWVDVEVMLWFYRGCEGASYFACHAQWLSSGTDGVVQLLYAVGSGVVVRSQKAVTAQLQSKQLPPFGFVQQCSAPRHFCFT